MRYRPGSLETIWKSLDGLGGKASRMGLLRLTDLLCPCKDHLFPDSHLVLSWQLVRLLILQGWREYAAEAQMRHA